MRHTPLKIGHPKRKCHLPTIDVQGGYIKLIWAYVENFVFYLQAEELEGFDYHLSRFQKKENNNFIHTQDFICMLCKYIYSIYYYTFIFDFCRTNLGPSKTIFLFKTGNDMYYVIFSLFNQNVKTCVHLQMSIMPICPSLYKGTIYLHSIPICVTT